MPTKTSSTPKLDTRTTAHLLDEDRRVISYVITDHVGNIMVSGGDLQTLVELLVQQTAAVVDEMGQALFDSDSKYFRLLSSYYSAFFLRNEGTRIGIIADNEVNAEDILKLVAWFDKRGFLRLS